MAAPTTIYTLPRLREIRIARFMTQDELGKLTGISRQSISQLERKNSPQRAKVSTVDKLAKALGVSRTDLMEESK